MALQKAMQKRVKQACQLAVLENHSLKEKLGRTSVNSNRRQHLTPSIKLRLEKWWIFMRSAVLVCMLPNTATVNIDTFESMRHRQYHVGAVECTSRERQGGNLAKGKLIPAGFVKRQKYYISVLGRTKKDKSCDDGNKGVKL